MWSGRCHLTTFNAHLPTRTVPGLSGYRTRAFTVEAGDQCVGAHLVQDETGVLPDVIVQTPTAAVR